MTGGAAAELLSIVSCPYPSILEHVSREARPARTSRGSRVGSPQQQDVAAVERLQPRLHQIAGLGRHQPCARSLLVDERFVKIGHHDDRRRRAGRSSANGYSERPGFRRPDGAGGRVGMGWSSHA